jgi:hypothetical protein
MTIPADALRYVCELLKKRILKRRQLDSTFQRTYQGIVSPKSDRVETSGKVATDYCTTRVKLVLCVNLADPELKVPVTVTL